MGQTSVVADTTHYLPGALVAAEQIHEVSLHVSLEGHEQRESEITDYDEFYGRLARSAESVATSQPSVGEFIEVYEPLLADGGEIVSIHLSAGISGTFESARQARQTLIDDGRGGERIELYDSRSAAGGFALVVLAASRAAASGASATEAAARARQAREALQMWFAVDTLEYLRRGGRIGGAQAFIGSRLQIKPILTMEEEVKAVDKVRTRRRVYDRLLEYARTVHEQGSDAWLLQHIQDPETIERLRADCTEIFGRPPVLVSEIGPVLGSHSGPGLLGIGAMPAALLD
ncbi:MAG: DegV family protein [Solirubrobacterales bacterium]